VYRIVDTISSLGGVEGKKKIEIFVDFFEFMWIILLGRRLKCAVKELLKGRHKSIKTLKF
jgi:hypothetical protein